MEKKCRLFLSTFAVLVTSVAQVSSQIVTLPPDGDNQRASVSQWIGLVEVNLTYHSPDVTAPDGTDRRGKIWGQLVPYGMTDLGFGTCGDQCPWRGGANENTVFRVSHDVKVEGQALPAGSYGLHFIPGENEWTVVFSKNYTSWGSFFYDAREDALRVAAKPEKSDYHHYLTYEFTDRQPNRATVALMWEDLKVPISITVDNVNDLYVENLRRELRSVPGFNWQGWLAAARFCLRNKVNLTEALTWAQNAVSLPFVGQENFQTLSVLSQVREANGKNAEAKATMDRALAHPTAGAIDIHQYGRSLLAQGKKQEALRVFELNAKKHAGAWPTDVGLARGYAAVGDFKRALKHARLALVKAPDEDNRNNLRRMIENLEKGESID
ncbi:MAG: DUF2911 domain-containing protein [Acidobacteriota bacterium]